jgi:hypothetical protein
MDLDDRQFPFLIDVSSGNDYTAIVYELVFIFI